MTLTLTFDADKRIPPWLLTRVRSALLHGHGGGRWRAGIVLVDGPSGSGKTTLTRALLEGLRTSGIRIGVHLDAGHMIAELRVRPRAPQVQVLRPDLFYPGWLGMQAGTAAVEALLTGIPAVDVGAGVLGSGPLTVNARSDTSATGPGAPAKATGEAPPVPAKTRAMALGHGQKRPGRTGHRVWDWHHSRAGGAVLLDPTRPVLVEGCGCLTPRTSAVADLAVWVEAAKGHDERRTRALARDGQVFDPWWQTWAEQDRAHLVRHRPDLLADIRVLT
ncbi:hypothetical protein I6B53_10590 [Schaalia sp. 19OD2882]|uniref:hypothetical protein n=1 Tax=Schaalia sp. 19OD2882 TaxID=2794089 RepID=UPI001C1EF501|nr:hypothetical protein [Schaalia sp. 19OD2882]QWW19507.1 hypothetical protein I6B53_10590 [Schaalia sp. 19OD2882]